MRKGWRKYIKKYIIKIEPLMFSLRLHSFMYFIKTIKKTYKFKEYKLVMRHKFDNIYELHFELHHTCPNNIKTHVLNCTLEALWYDKQKMEDNDMSYCLYKEGDYFQCSLNRENKDFKLSPNISFTAVFHEIIRNKRYEFEFIKNIYSTSKLSHNSFSGDAQMFWEKQVKNGFATLIEEEGRYKAII